MDTEISNTEGRILEAAKEQFIRNGLDGTSMQDIADAAGINKSLLHYYFRSKEKLFDAVFHFALQRFIPQIHDIVVSDHSIFTRIRMIVNQYLDMLEQNPFIPLFILHEIHRNPQRPAALFMAAGLDFDLILRNFVREEDKKNIRPVDPIHLIVNIISLCVFPYAASPFINMIMFNDDQESIIKFRAERKETIPEFIINAIRL
jgi:TetR/AcrR family transcriptional regulator